MIMKIDVLSARKQNVMVQCVVIFLETLPSNKSSALTGPFLCLWGWLEISCFPVAVLSRPPWILCCGPISVSSHSLLCCPDVFFVQGVKVLRFHGTWKSFKHIMTKAHLSCGNCSLAFAQQAPAKFRHSHSSSVNISAR